MLNFSLILNSSSVVIKFEKPFVASPFTNALSPLQILHLKCLENEGYEVQTLTNGTDAIERIYDTLPDIALVKLALEDISGDLVILQLKRMVKTQHIKFVLYSSHVAERTIIVDKISKKEGIDCFVQYSCY